ncbi:hypothetical protein MNBD_ALPHA03-480 [hydrothermal vent metagenome]|uniref:Rhodanese domain-containing protein n=1 Tax=hydrothermal vent metagenome TaxID=652676 RepID=A0A3B1BQ97_9ZZZZ
MKITSQQLLEEARAQIKSITVNELKSMMKKNIVEIIDVRDSDERTNKPHISGSHHAGRGMLEFYFDPESGFHMEIFQSTKQFVFVCGSGARASLAAKTASDMGLTNIAYLDGGMKAWLDS